MTNTDQYCDNLLRVFKNKCIIKNCCEVKFISADYGSSGVYRISRGVFGSEFNVYCDLVIDGGGWIVIQRNKEHSSTNFNRNWVDYKKIWRSEHLILVQVGRNTLFNTKRSMGNESGLSVYQ